MNDKAKYDALCRLSTLLALGKQPSIRESGYSEDTISQLHAEQLIELASDSRALNRLDQWGVVEITAMGHTMILEYEEKAKHAALHRPWYVRGSEAVGKKLWDLGWDLVKVGGSVWLGWYLHGKFK